MPDEHPKGVPTEQSICPICLCESKQPEVFYWIISPPFLAILLSNSKRLYVELKCCSICFGNIKRRRWLVRSLLIVIPVAVIAAFWAKAQWFPQISEALFAVSVTTIVVSFVVAVFARTGLDRVRVSDERLIEQGRRLSRRLLRNSTPWFLPSLSPYGAERVEISNNETIAP